MPASLAKGPEAGNSRAKSCVRLKLKFLGSRITPDAGLLAYRELDETLELTGMAPAALQDSRLGSNKQHGLLPLLRHPLCQHE